MSALAIFGLIMLAFVFGIALGLWVGWQASDAKAVIDEFNRDRNK